MKQQNVVSLSAFILSTGTLLCCTLPVLLSVIAGTAAVVSLISAAPWLITVSYYKEWIFIVAAIFLALGFFMVYRPKRECPIDAKDYCEPSLKFAKIMLWTSLVILLVGVFFAYILPIILFRMA